MFDMNQMMFLNVATAALHNVIALAGPTLMKKQRSLCLSTRKNSLGLRKLSVLPSYGFTTRHGSIQNELYKYPDVYVCLYNYYGSDTLEQEEDCIYSVNDTEGGMPSAILNPDRVNSTTLRSHVLGGDEVNEVRSAHRYVFHNQPELVGGVYISCGGKGAHP